MKKLSLLFLAALLFFSCKKDNGSNNQPNKISPFIESNYTIDAQRLLLRRIQNAETVMDKDKPEFNTIELNRILSNIQAVYNLNTPQTDSIFNTTKIHTFPTPSLVYISMHIDTNTAEGLQIIKQQPSENEDYDRLINQYGFTYTINNATPATDFTEIKSNRPYNLIALTAAFKNFPFIINAVLESSVGDGNNITYTSMNSTTSNDDAIALNFSIGTGDCPSGCTIRHGWIYNIKNGKAILAETY